MLKNINKLSLISALCFCVRIIMLMLNVLSEVFNLIFVILFIVGLVTLFIKKIQDYVVYSKETSNTKESMTIDMTLSSSGTFEMDQTTLSKNQIRELKELKREKFLPILVIAALIVLMAFFAFKLISNYFI